LTIYFGNRHLSVVNSIVDTVGSARAWALEELKKAGVGSAALTADLLLGHVLGWERVRVLSRPESALSTRMREAFANLVRRRIRGEPLQYLTGRQEFYGLSFRVSPEVLIPRPETEVLVEHAVLLARRFHRRPVRFVDVGTGSGCMAVAFASQVPDAVGCAVDISPAALGVARENADSHAVSTRIRFLCCDLLEGFAPRPLFDFVLSNPPYVALTEYNSLPGEVREHEPHLALFSGFNGLDVCRKLISQAARRLLPGGFLLVEIGLGQVDEVTQLLSKEGLCAAEVLNDLQNIPRCVVARSQ
jgi:release factor glutamine methyltransferase